MILDQKILDEKMVDDFARIETMIGEANTCADLDLIDEQLWTMYHIIETIERACSCEYKLANDLYNHVSDLYNIKYDVLAEAEGQDEAQTSDAEHTD